MAAYYPGLQPEYHPFSFTCPICGQVISAPVSGPEDAIDKLQWGWVYFTGHHFICEPCLERIFSVTIPDEPMPKVNAQGTVEFEIIPGKCIRALPIHRKATEKEQAEARKIQ